MLTQGNIERYREDLKKETESDVHDLHFERFGLNTEERQLVNRLVFIHGGGVLRRKQGAEEVELQVADPFLLEDDGDKELLSRHLYVNITKVVRDDHTQAARCVKDGRVYDIRTLLAMKPLEDRMPNIPKSKIRRMVSAVDYTEFYEEDEHGNLVPPGPGETVPLSGLGPEHPAIEYLMNREFDPAALETQFGACFCTKENPKLFYKRLPGGFAVTPQGRIVFKINQLGATRGWQARRLERWTHGGKFLEYWHPYRNRWVTIGMKDDNTGKLVLLKEMEGTPLGMTRDVILKNKYNIGLGVEKHNMLMGFDAAWEWSKQTGNRTIGIVEGVLDAARLGPPFVSIMGLKMSMNQGALVRNFFDRALVVPDVDPDPEKRKLFLEAVDAVLTSHGFPVEVLELPGGGKGGVKDAGDLTAAQAKRFREKYKLES